MIYVCACFWNEQRKSLWCNITNAMEMGMEIHLQKSSILVYFFFVSITLHFPLCVCVCVVFFLENWFHFALFPHRFVVCDSTTICSKCMIVTFDCCHRNSDFPIKSNISLYAITLFGIHMHVCATVIFHGNLNKHTHPDKHARTYRQANKQTTKIVINFVDLYEKLLFKNERSKYWAKKRRKSCVDERHKEIWCTKWHSFMIFYFNLKLFLVLRSTRKKRARCVCMSVYLQPFSLSVYFALFLSIHSSIYLSCATRNHKSKQSAKKEEKTAQSYHEHVQ